MRGDFRAGEAALGLVGLTGGAIDLEAADARVRELAAAPDPGNPYLVHPAGLWSYVVGPLSSAIRETASRESRTA